MSLPNPNKPYKNSFRWRNDSEELDVFEAAGYFSTVTDPNPTNVIREDVQYYERVPKPGRMSLDNMAARNPIIPAGEYRQKQMIKEGSKKCKQPSSPGGRLASFLNSLFHQASLKKKKPKSGGGGGGVSAEEEISPGGRRKRRSSISHFRITTAAESKATFSSSSGSGFRTPPPCVNTPTKSYKEFRSLPGRRQANVDCKNPAIIEEKLRIGKPGFSNKNFMAANWGDDSWDQLRKLSEEDNDDGGDSDSSSDLFDLPNHELDFYSRDLPVYGTTHMDRINCTTMGAPISSATA